jgi:hypothetical protein
MHDRLPLWTALASACLLSTAWAQEPSPAAEPSPPAAAGETTPSTLPPKDAAGFVTRQVRKLLSDGESGGAGPHLGPFYPSIASPSGGSGPGPVIHFWLPDIGSTKLDVHASAIYSLYRYQYYDFQFGWLPHRGQELPSFATGTDNLYPMGDLYKTVGLRRFDLYASAAYQDYPREKFYGLGPGTPEADRSDYTMRDTLFQVVSEFRPVSWLSLTMRGGLMHTDISPGEDDAFPDTETLFTDETAPALDQQPDYFLASAGLFIDTRDEHGNPHNGGTFAVTASRYDDRGGHAYEFNRLAIDARRFVRLGTDRHVLALRAVTSFDETDAGSRVPFYLQNALGGSNILRGFGSFRFRGNNLLAFSGEYRFEIVPKVEVAFFYDAGKVFEDRSDFDLHGLETSWGAGLRLKSPRKVKIRVDVGKSREHLQASLKFSPSF